MRGMIIYNALIAFYLAFLGTARHPRGYAMVAGFRAACRRRPVAGLDVAWEALEEPDRQFTFARVAGDSNALAHPLSAKCVILAGKISLSD